MKLDYEHHDKYSLYLCGIKGNFKACIIIELLKIKL